VRANRWSRARTVAQATPTLTVALGKSPSAMAFVLATKLVSGGRIVMRLGAVTHFGERGRREQLKLSHPLIISRPPRNYRPAQVSIHAKILNTHDGVNSGRPQ
jgi:hypothetical protein